MKLLAVLLVALAAMDLSGTSADDRDRDGKCRCYFPYKMEGKGSFQLFPKKSGTLSTRFLYIVDGTLGRVAFWMRRHYFYRSENPDYIMDLKADLLYKPERDRNVTCTKAKLPEEWRLPNCFPSGLSFRSIYPSGEYVFSNQDYSRWYIMHPNRFTKKQPCTPVSLLDNKIVTNGTTFIYYTNEDTAKNPDKLALDLSNCTQVETLNFPFDPELY